MHIFANLWCFLIAHQGIWNHSNRYLGWQQFQASFAKLFFAAKRPYIFFVPVYVTIHILCSCVRHPKYTLFLCTSPYIYFVPVYVTIHIRCSCVRQSVVRLSNHYVRRPLRWYVRLFIGQYVYLMWSSGLSVNLDFNLFPTGGNL